MWTNQLALWILTLITSGTRQIRTQVAMTDVFAGVHKETIEGIKGLRVMLPCKVNYPNNILVVWYNKRQTITLNNTRIIDDPRFTVSLPTVTENSWNLIIDQLKEQDAGSYRCIVNTQPPAVKHITLIVKVPPSIDNRLSSVDPIVKEGDTLELFCKTDGIPKPKVIWHRIHQNAVVQTQPIRVALEGQTNPLVIHNVTRECEGVYECVAKNNILPDANRRIRVTVLFKPDVKMVNDEIGQTVGGSTMLQCRITANPMEHFYWKYRGQRLKADTSCTPYTMKYCQDVWQPKQPHMVQMDLTIKNLTSDDYGIYTCVAYSTLGRSQVAASLIEIQVLNTVQYKPRHQLILENEENVQPTERTLIDNYKWTATSRSPIKRDKPFIKSSSEQKILTANKRNENADTSNAPQQGQIHTLLLLCLTVILICLP